MYTIKYVKKILGPDSYPWEKRMEVNESTKKRNKIIWENIGRKPYHNKRSASRNVFVLLPTSNPELDFLKP